MPIDPPEYFCPPDEDAPEWVTFTKRTEDPKLAWLERQLDAAGIPHRREGESFHAPILQVPKEHEAAAWKILSPVDDIPDNARRFRR